MLENLNLKKQLNNYNIIIILYNVIIIYYNNYYAMHGVS